MNDASTARISRIDRVSPRRKNARIEVIGGPAKNRTVASDRGRVEIA